MRKIGILIPEFPGQTHAFFVRERAELQNLGMSSALISTRKPKAGVASHNWASEAELETAYLFPMPFQSILQATVSFLVAGPRRWLNCFKVIFNAPDASFKEKIKLILIIFAGAHFKNTAENLNLQHVHVHSCANSANLAVFARILGGPTYSITLHGPLSDYGTNQISKWQHAAFAIVITQELMAEVKETLGQEKLPPVYLAPMGVNVDVFKRQTPYQSPNFDSTIKLVACGRLNFVKAHDDLIRTVKVLVDKDINVELKICGATDTFSQESGYLENLYQLRAELELDTRVHFLGSISEEDVRETLEEAHIFCLASLKEPLGVAIMEAMAMSMPVIVASSPGVTELVDNSIDGILVEPRSPDQFARAIIDLVERPEFVSTIRERARSKIVKSFHSGISAKSIYDGHEALSQILSN